MRKSMKRVEFADDA